MTTMTTPTNNARTTVLYDGPSTVEMGVRRGSVTEKIRRRVLLDPNGDTVTVYACASCDYTAATYGSVFAHRRSHNPSPRRPKAAPQQQTDPTTGLVDVLITALRPNLDEAVRITYAQGIDRATAAAADIIAERDRLRAEVKTLRRRLSTLGRALAE